MSFTRIPEAVKCRIFEFVAVFPTTFTSKEVLTSGNKLVKLRWINKECGTLVLTKFRLNDIKEIYRLVEKYWRDRIYYPMTIWDRIKKCPIPIEIERPPCLLDALFTGCDHPFATHSIKKYSEEVEADIRSIVRVMPGSIHCRQGASRLCGDLPPLYAACVNTNIPLGIVELLLENKADPYARITKNGSQIFLIHEILGECSRRSEIRELFEKYGFPDNDYIDLLSLEKAIADVQSKRFPSYENIREVAHRIIKDMGGALGNEQAKKFVKENLDYLVEQGVTLKAVKIYLEFGLLDRALELVSSSASMEDEAKLKALDAIIKAFEEGGRKEEAQKIIQMFEQLTKKKVERENLEFQKKLDAAKLLEHPKT